MEIYRSSPHQKCGRTLFTLPLTPLEVLGPAHGRQLDSASLHRAYDQMIWQRRTDRQGFIRLGRWLIYVESGLPRTAVEVTYWDGILRTEYQAYLLNQHQCQWDSSHHRQHQISDLQVKEHPYLSPQQPLFDAQWIREPVEEPRPVPPLRGATRSKVLYDYR